MESIRAVLIERLDQRIDRLRKGQRRLQARNLQDQLLDSTVARLVRVREVHQGMDQLEKVAQRTTENA